MGLLYTKKKDDGDNKTVNASEFMDRLVQTEKNPKHVIEEQKVESTE